MQKNWENDPQQLINMLQTMVLWIGNDYEDEDLKARAKEIFKWLGHLSDMESKKMEDVIKKLDKIEELLDRLIKVTPFQFPTRLETHTCPHMNVVPMHMVITGPMTFTCPDCGESIEVQPNVTW